MQFRPREELRCAVGDGMGALKQLVVGTKYGIPCSLQGSRGEAAGPSSPFPSVTHQGPSTPVRPDHLNSSSAIVPRQAQRELSQRLHTDARRFAPVTRPDAHLSGTNKIHLGCLLHPLPPSTIRSQPLPSSRRRSCSTVPTPNFERDQLQPLFFYLQLPFTGKHFFPPPPSASPQTFRIFPLSRSTHQLPRRGAHAASLLPNRDLDSQHHSRTLRSNSAGWRSERFEQQASQ